jgi:hypothetical protein
VTTATAPAADIAQLTEREAWARRVRSIHDDGAVEARVSRSASTYGSPEEIQAAIRDLRAQAREVRRRLPRGYVNTVEASWQAYRRQPTEAALDAHYALIQRLDPDATDSIVRTLNGLALEFQHDRVPLVGDRTRCHVPASTLVLIDRREAARGAAFAAAQEEADRRSIDDAAWAAELARRARPAVTITVHRGTA